MSDNSSTWVLSRGSYSDYRVLAVCSSKEVATTLAARMNAVSAGHYGDSVEVESLPTVSDAAIERVEILRLTQNLYDDGTEDEQQQSYRVEWPFDTLYTEEALPVHWRWVRAPMHNNRGGRLEVGGTDHERVRKVFGDRRAMLKSEPALRAKREQVGR